MLTHISFFGAGPRFRLSERKRGVTAAVCTTQSDKIRRNNRISHVNKCVNLFGKMPHVSKQWVLSRRVKSGRPAEEEDFAVEEKEMPALRKDEVLCRALFFSVDPITRLYLSYGLNEGEVVPGRQVARVVESRNKEFPKGKLVVGYLGWQTYSIVNPKTPHSILGQETPVLSSLPQQMDNSGLQKTACLGVLGQNGLMAYLALLHTCRLREGETLALTSAAGATGHIAGQLAKFMGAKVIAFTGDTDKASWIKTELGFDWAFNYKRQDVSSTLKIAAPDGIDVFLDSVGGDIHAMVLERMRVGGRVCILGNLSCYDDVAGAAEKRVRPTDVDIALKGLTISGFNALHFPLEKREAALDQLSEWCQSGQVEPREETLEGFENLPRALIDTLAGKYCGKVVLRI